MAGQNRSSSVMQQRLSAPDALDYFPTPPWATRALCEFLQGPLIQNVDQQRCWEPACGELHMVRPLQEYFDTVRFTDVHDYGQVDVADFTLEAYAQRGEFDWIITNPPFNLSLQFSECAMTAAKRGFALLVRSSWLEGAERWRTLFRDTPPSYVLSFAQRVVMLEGRLIQDGKPDPFNLDEDGKPKKASSATSYCWVIWMRGARQQYDHDTKHRWVGDRRLQLERPGDYPEYPEQWAAITEGNSDG